MGTETDTRVIKNGVDREMEELRSSALSILDKMREVIESEDVINFHAILFFRDNTYQVFKSDGIQRHTRIGMLMEMIHDILEH